MLSRRFPVECCLGSIFYLMYSPMGKGKWFSSIYNLIADKCFANRSTVVCNDDFKEKKTSNCCFID